MIYVVEWNKEQNTVGVNELDDHVLKNWQGFQHGFEGFSALGIFNTLEEARKFANNVKKTLNSD